jgi:hypothetical protein
MILMSIRWPDVPQCAGKCKRHIVDRSGGKGMGRDA